MRKVFIEGEKVDLCVPAEEDFHVWSSWFNDQKITRFLDQGKFPNTLDAQKEFYAQALKSNRFIALIRSKEDVLLGVISLSEISYEKSSCQMALVCPVKAKSAPLAALEAIALATEHAFKRLGIKRVWAGQAYPGLERWTQALEVIGFKTEGVLRQGFVHGWEVSDAISIAVVLEDFLTLTDRRNGVLWPGEQQALFMIKKLRVNKTSARIIHESVGSIYREADKLLAEIESSYAL